MWLKLTHQPCGLVLVQKVKTVALKWVITVEQISACHSPTVLGNSD
jgi:hypothetical protein